MSLDRTPNLETYIVSRPIECRWMGFISDTLTLQEEGWQLSVNQRPYDRTIQVAIYHPEYQLYGVSAPLNMPVEKNKEIGYLQFQISLDVRVELIKVINKEFIPFDAEPVALLSDSIDPITEYPFWFRPIDNSIPVNTLSFEKKASLKPKIIRKLKI